LLDPSALAVAELLKCYVVPPGVHIPRGTVHRNQSLTDKPARSIELNIWHKDKPALGLVND